MKSRWNGRFPRLIFPLCSTALDCGNTATESCQKSAKGVFVAARRLTIRPSALTKANRMSKGRENRRNHHRGDADTRKQRWIRRRIGAVWHRPLRRSANATRRAMAWRLGFRLGESFGKIGRSERIRTSDPLLPKQVRYQTALRSDRGQGVTGTRGSLQDPTASSQAIISHPTAARTAAAMRRCVAGCRYPDASGFPAPDGWLKPPESPRAGRYTCRRR